jgi:monooxygenase
VRRRRTRGRDPHGRAVVPRSTDYVRCMSRTSAPPDVDVLIVGAGISGIGVACHLTTKCPERSFRIVEGRSRIGGTWDLFRFPGVRSDSDMITLAYQFRPWTDEVTVPDGETIRRYLEDTAREYGVTDKITFDTKVESASWDSATSRWTVTVRRVENTSAAGDGTAAGASSHASTETITCRWLQMCSGYYAYETAHRPRFVDEEMFAGPIVHPQHWPEDLDLDGKRVVVIGSGATAVTMVPALVDPMRTNPPAAHVTMLQRSPTWIAPGPTRNPLALRLHKLLPERVAAPLLRELFAGRTELIYRTSRSKPDKLRGRLTKMQREVLGDDFRLDPDFTPSYDPWDQRLCLAADADIFTEIREGRVDVVTDTIARFTETGIELASGRHLDADVIVTATGLELLTLGGVAIELDGEPVDFGQRVTYKSFMYSDVPNLATIFGYINASWTLRVDLVADYVCRMLQHMDATGTAVATPRLPDDPMPLRPYVDDAEFNPGYMQRGLHLYPKQGDREPWIASQSYWHDRKLIGKAEVDDGAMEFAPARAAERQPANMV